MLSYVFENKEIYSIVKQKIYTVIDVIVSLVIFILLLKIFPPTSSYNTNLISLDIILTKLRETLEVMISQFVITLPFMEYKYKLLLLLSSISGLFVLLKKGGISKVSPQILLFLLVLFVSKFTYFISDQRGELITQMEDFAFVPRLDFYSLPYLYALCLSPILFLKKSKLKNVLVGLFILITFMSVVRVMNAQKVWKLGFDAEMKAHERIISRIEQMPNFDINRHYRVFQIGTLSLRKNFYKKSNNEKISLDLLETSFTPRYMSQIVYNFYYPKDVFYSIANFNDLSEAGKAYIKNTAQPWPSKNSIFIDNDIIVIVLDDSVYSYK